LRPKHVLDGQSVSPRAVGLLDDGLGAGSRSGYSLAWSRRNDPEPTTKLGWRTTLPVPRDPTPDPKRVRISWTRGSCWRLGSPRSAVERKAREGGRRGRSRERWRRGCGFFVPCSPVSVAAWWRLGGSHRRARVNRTPIFESELDLFQDGPDWGSSWLRSARQISYPVPARKTQPGNKASARTRSSGSSPFQGGRSGGMGCS